MSLAMALRAPGQFRIAAGSRRFHRRTAARFRGVPSTVRRWVRLVKALLDAAPLGLPDPLLTAFLRNEASFRLRALVRPIFRIAAIIRSIQAQELSTPLRFRLLPGRWDRRSTSRRCTISTTCTSRCGAEYLRRPFVSGGTIRLEAPLGPVCHQRSGILRAVPRRCVALDSTRLSRAAAT